MDSLLRSAYPFISEGRGLTNTLAPLEIPYNLRVLPHLLPEGEEDAASLTIGQPEGRPLTVMVWKNDKVAFCNFGKSAKIVDEEEVTLHDITGWKRQKPA